MSSSLLVKMLLESVPEGYLPSAFIKSEYTFPYLAVSKSATEEIPFVMVQAKAMYHRMFDAIHGLVFDVDAMGYSSVKKLHPGEVYMMDFAGHIELPRHNALLTVLMWEPHHVANYFADTITQLVMQFQDEMIGNLLSLSPELLCQQEKSMFQNYLNLREANPKARLLVNSITSSYVHNHSLSDMITKGAIALHDMAVSQLASYLKQHHYELTVKHLEHSNLYTKVDVEGFDELLQKIEYHPNLILTD